MRQAIAQRTSLLLGIGGALIAALVLGFAMVGGEIEGEVLHSSAPAATAEAAHEDPPAPDRVTGRPGDAHAAQPPAAAPHPLASRLDGADPAAPADDAAADEMPEPPRKPNPPPRPAAGTARDVPSAPPQPIALSEEAPSARASVRPVANPAPAPSPAATAAVQQSAETRQDGIYLVRDDGRRELLVPTVVARVAQEGGGLFSRPEVFAIVNGLNASIRSRSHYQAFEFVFPAGRAAITGQVTHPNQYVLIQLYEEEEYDERTFDVLPGGPDPEVIVPFRTEQLDARTYRIDPEVPLGLGEFAFFILEAGVDVQAGLTIFDFGIDP